MESAIIVDSIFPTSHKNLSYQSTHADLKPPWIYNEYDATNSQILICFSDYNYTCFKDEQF